MFCYKEDEVKTISLIVHYCKKTDVKMFSASQIWTKEKAAGACFI